MRKVFDSVMNRLIYFLNVVDTYFLAVGLASAAILVYSMGMHVHIGGFIASAIFYAVLLSVVLKKINFFPHFLLFAPLFIIGFLILPSFNAYYAMLLLGINIAAFLAIQLLFYSMPYIIITKNPKVLLTIPINSLFTLAPTNSSAVISVFFSSLFSFFVFFRPNPVADFGAAALLLGVFLAAAAVVRFIPKHEYAKHLPKSKEAISKNVVYFNIDGARFDKFMKAKTPFLKKLMHQSAYAGGGARSVYPALTNPAFISILTGAPPSVHGIMNNNFKSGLKIDALPDIVETSNYGNIHFSDVSKKTWDTNVLSLSKHGLKIDDALMEKLKHDMQKGKSRLFIADLSLVDMCGHAFGSESREYLDAFSEIDKKLEDFFGFLKKSGLIRDTVIIISSDHGQAGMDHGYTLSKSENIIPFIVSGKGIKEGYQIKIKPSILDINATISYILGVRYAEHCQGRVLSEIFQ